MAMLDGLRRVFLEALSFADSNSRKKLVEDWNEQCEEVYRYKNALIAEERAKHKTTADFVEVKHGEWINGRYNDFQDNVYEEQCSICGRYSKDYGRDFCSNCGAKMDGGKKE